MPETTLMIKQFYISMMVICNVNYHISNKQNFILNIYKYCVAYVSILFFIIGRKRLLTDNDQGSILLPQIL